MSLKYEKLQFLTRECRGFTFQERVKAAFGCQLDSLASVALPGWVLMLLMDLA
jgi:hypothetical protein